MKILSGNLKDKNINFNCKRCNANFELESRDDFYINNWIYKPVNRYAVSDYNIKIPVYSIKCPVCGYSTYIGVDPADCGDDYNEALLRNCYAEIIFNRDDWKERFKTDVKIRTLGGGTGNDSL